MHYRLFSRNPARRWCRVVAACYQFRCTPPFGSRTPGTAEYHVSPYRATLCHMELLMCASPLTTDTFTSDDVRWLNNSSTRRRTCTIRDSAPPHCPTRKTFEPHRCYPKLACASKGAMVERTSKSIRSCSGALPVCITATAHMNSSKVTAPRRDVPNASNNASTSIFGWMRMKHTSERITRTQHRHRRGIRLYYMGD